MARGSGIKLAGHGLLLVFLILLQGGVAQSKEWYVGDQKGWTFGVQGWPNSPNFKPFREGDVLGTYGQALRTHIVSVGPGVFHSMYNIQ